MLNLTLKHQELKYSDGLRCWESVEEKAQYPVSETAVVIVDMWDQHWSDGATRQRNTDTRAAKQRNHIFINVPFWEQNFELVHYKYFTIFR